LHLSFSSKEIEYFENDIQKSNLINTIRNDHFVDKRNPDYYGILNISIDITKGALRVNLLMPVYELFIQEGQFLSFRNCLLDNEKQIQDNPNLTKLLNDLMIESTSFIVIEIVKNEENEIIAIYLDINKSILEFIREAFYDLIQQSQEQSQEQNIYVEIPIKRTSDNKNFEEVLSELNTTEQTIRHFSTFPYLLNLSLQYDFVLEIDHYVHQIENTFSY